MGPVDAAEVARFVEAGEMSDKVAVLKTLSAGSLVEFERAAQLASASPDDLALIGSYRDLQLKRTPSSAGMMHRSDSEAYWHRATGEQDFERAAPRGASCEARTDAEYWDQVTEANSTEDADSKRKRPPPSKLAMAAMVSEPAQIPERKARKSFWDTMVDNSG